MLNAFLHLSKSSVRTRRGQIIIMAITTILVEIYEG